MLCSLLIIDIYAATFLTLYAVAVQLPQRVCIMHRTNGTMLVGLFSTKSEFVV